MKALHVLAAAALAASFTVHAQQATTAGDHASHHSADSAAKLPANASQGEVRKVDMQAGKVTLKHGPLDNLKMPGMTMTFKAADPNMLEGLKEGDKVRFVAEDKGGLTVTAIEPAAK